jgi:hypothetical protein
LGYTLISLGADAVIVYLIIHFLLLRDERKRWNIVEGKALALIGIEMTAVVSLVEDFLLPNIPVTESTEVRLARMKEIVAPGDLMDFERFVSPKITECASLFHEQSRRLGDLQLRYSSRLKPELIRLLIDVEESLESVYGGLSLVREDPKNSNLKAIALLGFYGLIQRLVTAIDDGMIMMFRIPERLGI